MVVDEWMGMPILFVIKGVSIAAVCLHGWDWIVNLAFEKDHMWTKPFCHMKFQYLWSRYMGLAGQIANLVLLDYFERTKYVPQEVCTNFFRGQVVLALVQTLTLQITTALRVAAVYERSWTCMICLGVLIIVDFGATAMLELMTVERVRTKESCIMLNLPDFAMIIPIVQLGTQVILWSLTVIRSYPRKAVPLGSLVLRDGTGIFVALAVLLGGILAQTFLTPRGKYNVPPQACQIFYPLVILVTTTANCWLIRNMDSYSRKENQRGNMNLPQQAGSESVILDTIVSDESSSDESSRC